MNAKDIISNRLINQQIAGTGFSKPQEIVTWLGAVQAQDWAMAKWAIGLRLPGSCDKDIEEEFNKGTILRTHMLRPTWHFVSPDDIRWMLKLTAPRVHTLNALYYRKFELDAKLNNKCKNILVRSLRNLNFMTRENLNAVFAREKIIADRLRLTYIMMHAELEGLICSGPRHGKQFTYALLDERVKQVKHLNYDESIKELATRYFTSHGPATMKDYIWWSGLKVKDAKVGIEMLGKDFITEIFKGDEFIFLPNAIRDLKKSQSTFLLPDYDEYGISYKDRSMYNNPKWQNNLNYIVSEYYHALTVDGYFGGTWTRTLKADKPVVEVFPHPSLTKVQLHSVAQAVKKYLKFYA